jgi:hypothetical protein
VPDLVRPPKTLKFPRGSSIGGRWATRLSRYKQEYNQSPSPADFRWPEEAAAGTTDGHLGISPDPEKWLFLTLPGTWRQQVAFGGTGSGPIGYGTEGRASNRPETDVRNGGLECRGALPGLLVHLRVQPATVGAKLPGGGPLRPGDLLNRAARVEKDAVVAAVSIGLQVAAEAGQELRRAVTLSR